MKWLYFSPVSSKYQKMSGLSVSFCHYLHIFFLLFWESSSFDPNWFQVNRSIFLEGLALIFGLKEKNIRVCFSDHIWKGESLVHFHWVYLLPVTPSDSFWWPEAQCLWCDVMVSVEGKGCPSPFFFLGSSGVKSLGTPLPALELLQQSHECFAYEHICYKE